VTPFNPATDLKIDRLIKASPATIWRCWQDPDLFRQWFCPEPVEVADCDIDLRPGGRCFVEMRLPDGTMMPNDGCFLLVEPERRMISTDALLPRFRPQGAGFMTVDITLTPEKDGTRYATFIMHATDEQRQQHLTMGFEGGWGSMLAQLDALAQSLE